MLIDVRQIADTGTSENNYAGVIAMNTTILLSYPRWVFYNIYILKIFKITRLSLHLCNCSIFFLQISAITINSIYLKFCKFCVVMLSFYQINAIKNNFFNKKDIFGKKLTGLETLKLVNLQISNLYNLIYIDYFSCSYLS